MSGPISVRLTRQKAKDKSISAILGDTTTTLTPKKSILKKTTQPEITTSSATPGPSKPLSTVSPVDSNCNSEDAMDHTPINNSTSTETPVNISEQTTMDVDATPVNPSPKGKEKENSTPLPFGNFTRRLNFTVIADFSAIPEKLSRSQQMDMIDL